MFSECFWGAEGFEEVRKYIKQGNEFCKEISAILQEKCDLDVQYSKALSKVSAKLSKCTALCSGSLADAWNLVATEMETEAEVRKQLSQSLQDDVIKPMKSLAESITKQRKPLETTVEKAHKIYIEQNNDSIKVKVRSFQNHRHLENLQEQVSLGKDSKGKALPEKEIAKLQKSCYKMDIAARKTDEEYLESVKKAELSRQDWSTKIELSSESFQEIEESRIQQMKDLLIKYNGHLTSLPPRLSTISQKISEGILLVDISSDIHRITERIGRYPRQAEQVLPDYYAEDLENALDLDRRKKILSYHIDCVQTELEKEKRAQEGVQRLLDAYVNKPDYADASTQKDTQQKLTNLEATMHLLEATADKLNFAVSDMDKSSRPESKYTSHIQKNKDKQGLVTSVLKFPSSGTSVNRVGSARLRVVEGQGRTEEALVERSSISRSLQSSRFISRQDSSVLPSCRVIYPYEGKESDELSIQPGDVVAVLDKQSDGWWRGSIHGRVGVFPGSYVEET